MGWCVCGGKREKKEIKNRRKIKKGFYYYAHWHWMALETWHLLGQILLSAETKRLRPTTSVRQYAVLLLEQYAAGDLVAGNGQFG